MPTMGLSSAKATYSIRDSNFLCTPETAPEAKPVQFQRIIWTQTSPTFMGEKDAPVRIPAPGRTQKYDRVRCDVEIPSNENDEVCKTYCEMRDSVLSVAYFTRSLGVSLGRNNVARRHNSLRIYSGQSRTLVNLLANPRR